MKKKVLFVVYNAFNRGGIQNVLMNIVKELNDDFSFDLLCFQDEKGGLEKEFLSFGGKIVKEPIYYTGSSMVRRRLDYYMRGMSIYRCVSRVIKENGPYQAIHCNNAAENGVCVLAGKHMGVPVRIAHSHTNFSNRENYLRRIITSVYLELIKRYATNRIGCSEEACLSLYGSMTDSEVISNPYDEQRFTHKCDRPRKFDAPQLIQIASYSSNKNQLFSVQVLEEMRKQYPDTTLNLVGYDGEPGYLQKVQEEIMRNDLQNHVRFFPADADLPVLLDSSTYLIFPSVAEGFGMVPVEAQAMGLRCFISDSVPRKCDCGGSVFLSLSSGARFWANKICEDFLKTNGEHQFYDCSQYSIEQVGKKYREIYLGEREHQ